MSTNKKQRGRPKNCESPEQLYEWFEEYKESSSNSPMMKMDFKGRDNEEVHYLLEKPLTWTGFSVWLFKNKGMANLHDYKANTREAYTNFSSIIRMIGDEIFDHQYNGAAVGVFQHNIIARKLGLTDKTEAKVESSVTIDFTEED